MAARLPTPNVVTATAEALHARYVQHAADWRRDHLGASLIGRECDRFLWLQFRWAAKPAIDGRTARLLDRGNREEAWIIDDLRAIGLQVDSVDPATGEQWSMPREWGNFGGACDFIVRGLLEAPDIPHVGECKTHNLKSFGKLKANGVRRAKPEHWAQMQIYMAGLKLQWAFYIAVCKDDDNIHTERVPFDEVASEELISRGIATTWLDSAPAKLTDSESPPCVYTSADGTRWLCQFYGLCHGKRMPERNCRTCISCSPTSYGMSCAVHGIGFINAELARKACDKHVVRPDMVNAQVADVDEHKRRIVFQFADGSQSHEYAS